MATMASRAKITRLLSKLTHKTPSFASGFRSNGAIGQIRVNPFGVSGFPFSFSAAPLESNVMGSKDYEDYRRSLYGGITHKALLVDAVGTLVVPSQPMAQASSLSVEIYRQIGDKYGVEYSEAEILNRYRWAYEQPWGRSRLRHGISVIRMLKKYSRLLEVKV
ncbi:hypothetical protein HYC85_022311 [Camellia sinensis]|uniref:Uncharacterized protein n=1 Tax=Camellia sinensis TaxID=4442 RepID=A0A7J7GNZ3_CAMSI|nr:hypothetical protein HYC85_022311 [Camellia sinensis]